MELLSLNKTSRRQSLHNDVLKPWRMRQYKTLNAKYRKKNIFIIITPHDILYVELNK